MSHDEVRNAFLGYYEKRLKLNLLMAELQNIVETAQTINLPEDQWPTSFHPMTFGLEVLETALSDTFTILSEKPELLVNLLQLRNRCRLMNTKIQGIVPLRLIPLSAPHEILVPHNREVAEEAPRIIAMATAVMRHLRMLISE